jgi:ubiquinone/menaquinone biosynthesis C-methylase UbiE
MTLPRTLEPEVMDSAEDASQYNDMDHSQPNQSFVEDMIHFLRTDESVAAELDDDHAELIDVLDVGTGTALIPVALCEQHASFRVIAIDLAVNMLELANYNVQASECCQQIQLMHTDAKTLDFDSEMFDLVMSNSIIHHIPEPQACLAEMIRVMSPDGAIFVRDLLRPADEQTVESLVETYAGDESDYSRQLFRQSLHASLSLEEIQQLVADLGFDPASVSATSDRHWTWAAFAQVEDD